MPSEFCEGLKLIYDSYDIHKNSIYNYHLFSRELKFLNIFLCLQCFIDEPKNNFLLDFTQKVQSLLLDDDVKFSELYITESFDFYVSEVLYQLWLIKKDFRSKISFPNISSLPTSDTIITEFIPSVLKNFEFVSKIGYVPVYVPETILQHIEQVNWELNLLQNFVWFVSERFKENQLDHGVTGFFTHVLAVAGHASSLLWLYFPDMAEEELNDLLSDILHLRIKPIQPCIRKIYVDVLKSLKSTIQFSGWYADIRNEDAVKSQASFLETILQNLPTNSLQEVALKDQLVILQGMLNLLRPDIIHVPVQHLELLLQDIDTVVIDAGVVVYSLCRGKEEKEDVAPGEISDAQIHEMSSKIQHVNTEIYLTIRKAFQSNLPRIHGLGYVDFLLNNLKEFQSRHPDSLASIRSQLQMIQKELESLQPFLTAVAEEPHKDLNDIHLCATQLIGKAYEVEYLVDACTSKEAPVWCYEHWLLDIMTEITGIKDQVAIIWEKKMVSDAIYTVTAHATSNLERSTRMNEEFVGFGDVIETLRNQLIRGIKGLDVISIVGMPGLGKTTLAYRLYSDSLVASHFDVRAQYCVSQIYSPKHLLRALLCEVIGEDSKHRDMNADELADELRKALFSKRYLILLDDLWEPSAWDDLRGCFPDNDNGSRIILTTRNYDVADYARTQSDPHLLRMFHDDESWELLRKKVFREESYPPLLKNIGQKIAEKCGQLPLSVALVAGILSRMEKKEESWQQLVNNLGPHIHNDSRNIIEQSYRVLPYHLRSCFLYFGAFLEDRVIDVSKLTRMWISEGFIKSCQGKNLEDIAEGYLDNLVGRNLVMGTKKNYVGMIKACYIHDLLHDFCKERAKEEKLVLSIKRDEHVDPSSRVYNHKQLAHRMSIYGEGYCIRQWSSCWSHVGSVILHDDLELFDSGVSYLCHNFKFLKVLDLEFTTVDSFPIGLVYLRYFAARTSTCLDLSSIDNLSNLETLIFKYYRLYPPPAISLPIALWKMVKMRNLHIEPCVFTMKNVEEHHMLQDLRTLSCPYFDSVKDAELVFSRTPNLRKLECSTNHLYKGSECSILNFPTQMRKLKIIPARPTIYSMPFFISAPNLNCLSLYYFRLHPQHMSNIALLQQLQVLKLRGVHMVDIEWKVSDGEFPRLKVLKLEKLVRFYTWTVTDDAFPNLERLVLRHCNNLEEIPSCFGEISSLKYIEVDCCNFAIEELARDIRETQVEDYQNSGFEILIIQGEKKNNNADSVNYRGSVSGGGSCGEEGKNEEEEEEEKVGRLVRAARLGRRFFSQIKEYFLSTNQFLLYVITFRLLG